MWRWPRMTPGSVSTSRSFMVSRCFCAKPRTCACANLMSSRSRFATWPIACSISCGVSLKFSGDHLSNCRRQLAHRRVAALLDLIEDALDGRAHLRVGFFDRAGVHSAFEEAGHGVFPFFLYPPLEGEGRRRSRRGGVTYSLRDRPPPAALRAATSPSTGEVKQSHFIACGLIGLPVPPVMISGGPQKKNSYTLSLAQSSARSLR